MRMLAQMLHYIFTQAIKNFMNHQQGAIFKIKNQ
jgi:hypothetical protein